MSEPVGGAHQNPGQAAALLDVALDRALAQVSAMDVDTRLEARYQKFRAMGQIGIDSSSGLESPRPSSGGESPPEPGTGPAS